MRYGLALVGFLAFCCTAAAGQHSIGEARSDSRQTIAVDVDRVNVVFSVSDGHGRFITNLRPEDFVVLEDDVPQRITNFSNETDLPLNVVVLFDTSGSIRDSLHFEQEAAAKFFYTALHRGRDRALVMTFDTTAQLRQDFADDPAVLEQAVHHIIPGGSTSLYDAVYQAVYTLADQPGRRVIVIISDGMDNSSHVSLERALEFAQKNNTAIYAVSTNGMEPLTLPEQRVGDANLGRLATQTGGQVLRPKKAAHLSRAFNRISIELRSQYSLAYKPSNTQRDGAYREIRIVPKTKQYRVQCRHGYFAPASGM